MRVGGEINFPFGFGLQEGWAEIEYPSLAMRGEIFHNLVQFRFAAELWNLGGHALRVNGVLTWSDHHHQRDAALRIVRR